MVKRRLVVAFLLLGVAAVAPLRAQYLLENHEPMSLSRRQIAADPLRVIFRAGQDSLAREVARWGAFYREITAFSPQRGRPFPIVMWGQTVVPNGMVAWTPSRMELYPLTGGEERTPVPWLQQLMVHEIRHYAQMEALDRKVIRALYYLLGQQNVGIGALLPANWYFEGDAIHSESKYSLFGRAHSAAHLQSYRADLLDGQVLSYDQYRCGSLRYKVPNHYSYGTMMIESTVARYGEQLWPRVMEYSVKYPILINPGYFALKRYTRGTPFTLFWDAMDEADSIFIARTEPGERPAPIARGAYRSEREPWRPGAGRFHFQWVSDLSHTLTFERVDDSTGESKVLFRPGAKMGAARYGDSVALWVEAVRHPRWGNVVWGDVYAYRLSSGMRERITHWQRLLSPVPLAGDSTFAAISLAENGVNRVVRFRLSVGRALDTARLSQPIELRELSRGNSPDEIFVRGVTVNGAYVLAYDWRSARVDTLIAPAALDIGSLTPAGDSGFFFTASRNGRQQPFYARRAKCGGTEALFRVAMRNHGVDDLSTDGEGGLSYSEFTINGYRAKRTTAFDLRPCAALPKAQSLFPLAQELPNGAELPAASDTLFPSKRYSPLRHAVRIHSWTPFYLNPFGGLSGLEDIRWGATVTSQNTTGTLAFSMGYFYKERHGASLTAIWQGLWPALSLNATYGGDFRRTTYADTVLLEPHSVAVSLAASVPLNFRSGAVFFGLLPKLSVDYSNNAVGMGVPGGIVRGIVNVGYGVSFSALRVLAPRDLYPPRGIRLNVNGRNMVRPARLTGTLAEAHGTLYLPGFYENHSLRLSGFAAKSFKVPRAVIFSMPIRGLALGYPVAELQTTEGWSAAVDYTLPLGYPDWSLRGWLYVQRVYANAAFSYARYSDLKGGVQLKRALFLDLVSDFYLFRFEFKITLGASVGYSPWGDKLGPRPWGPWSLNGIFNVGL